MPPGVYTVTVSDNNSCTASASFTITEPDTLLVTAVIDDILCNGELTGEIDITVTGGTAPYLFNWSNGATTEDLTGLSAGSYSVTITDVNGCSVEYLYTVTEPAPIVITGTSVNITCYGYANASIDISVTGNYALYILVE